MAMGSEHGNHGHIRWTVTKTWGGLPDLANQDVSACSPHDLQDPDHLLPLGQTRGFNSA
jgi:hypothetical protein